EKSEARQHDGKKRDSSKDVYNIAKNCVVEIFYFFFKFFVVGFQSRVYRCPRLFSSSHCLIVCARVTHLKYVDLARVIHQSHWLDFTEELTVVIIFYNSNNRFLR